MFGIGEIAEIRNLRRHGRSVANICFVSCRAH